MSVFSKFVWVAWLILVVVVINVVIAANPTNPSLAIVAMFGVAFVTLFGGVCMSHSFSCEGAAKGLRVFGIYLVAFLVTMLVFVGGFWLDQQMFAYIPSELCGGWAVPVKTAWGTWVLFAYGLLAGGTVAHKLLRKIRL